MVTRSDIEMAYRLLLRREPESEAVFDNFLPTPTLEDLLRIFLQSDEFSARFGRSQAPLEGAAIRVDAQVPEPLLAAMIAHVEATWSALGASEPYWSVLSVPEFRRDTFEANASRFRESGRMDVQRLQAFAARADIDLAQFHRCLELGCGVGRITSWLAGLFPSVLAADISRAHLDVLAREVAAQTVQGVLLPKPDAILALPEFDVFFSVIALQHNPPPIIALLLRNVLIRLLPGGIAYFQVPTYRRFYHFEAQAYVAALGTEMARMEMHVLPQATIFELAEECGCTVLEVREDTYTGDSDGVSNTFFIRKRARRRRLFRL